MRWRWFRGLLEAKESLSETDIKRGVRAVIGDGICSMSMGALQGGAFLTAFALAVGATNFEIGLIASIGLASQLMQVPGLYLAQRLPNRRGLVILFASISRLLWLFVLLIPLLFPQRGATFLIFILFTAFMLGNIPGPAWNSVLRDLIPEKSLGSVFSRRMMLGNLAAMLLTLFGGYFVDFWKGQYQGQASYSYSLLFFLGLLFGLASIFFISRIPEPAIKRVEGFSLVKLLSVPFQDNNFRTLIIFMGIWNFAINLAAPFFTVYMLKRLELSLFMVTILFTVSQMAVILFLPVWGKVSDRFSNKSVLRVSAPLFLVAIIAWSFTTLPEKYFLTIPLLFLIQIFGGVSFAGLALAGGNISLKLAPHGQAMAYLTAMGTVTAIASAIGPVLGGILGHIFATRELALSLQFAQPGADISIYALNFRGLDFLFFIAFITGFYALSRLRHVKEEGEVTEGIVVQEVVNEVLSPMKSIASIGGQNRVIALPIEMAYRGLLKTLGRNNNKE
jgi:MFS family permease